jgi:uncharacterized protein
MIEMIDDDLDAPLGQFAVRKRPSLGKLSFIGVAIAGAGLLGALALIPLDRDQRPLSETEARTEFPGPPETARFKTPELPETPAPQQLTENSGGARPPLSGPSATGASFPMPPLIIPDSPAGQGAEAIEQGSGVKVIRSGGAAAPGALIINVARALSTGLPAAPDPGLVEQTHYGLVPRIGPYGARPAEIYARAAASAPGLPRIALLIGGMGLSSHVTDTAIATLPGPVTLGFAPYGTDLGRQTTRAREAGHELVLQIPMEPFNSPRDNPGPHTLLAAAGKSGNSDNLTWLLSRFTGYAGVANFLGGKFTADEQALTPVLQTIAARGLFYVDDGTSARSLAMTLAPGQALTAARADIVLDSLAEPGAIEAALARLEAIARDKGLAIGVASALPASIDAIGRFARGLDARGIALVPLSATMPNSQHGLLQQGLLQQGLSDHQP